MALNEGTYVAHYQYSLPIPLELELDDCPNVTFVQLELICQKLSKMND